MERGAASGEYRPSSRPRHTRAGFVMSTAVPREIVGVSLTIVPQQLGPMLDPVLRGCGFPVSYVLAAVRAS